MVNFARCKVLEQMYSFSKQKPWDGKLEYDYQLWIDSDIVFDTAKFCNYAILHFLPMLLLKDESHSDCNQD